MSHYERSPFLEPFPVTSIQEKSHGSNSEAYLLFPLSELFPLAYGGPQAEKSWIKGSLSSASDVILIFCIELLGLAHLIPARCKRRVFVVTWSFHPFPPGDLSSLFGLSFDQLFYFPRSGT